MRAPDHAEQIARVVGIGDHVEILVQPGRLELIADVAQRREVLDRETDAVERRDLPEQPFRYDLLLPALRKSSRASVRFMELMDTRFAELAIVDDMIHRTKSG